MTPNLVWSIFDFAAVVVNPGNVTADVTVTHGGASLASVSVAPGASREIYLPWVPALKGADSDVCGAINSPGTSALVSAGAYHLVSSRPVSVYQFNPLEYQGSGGPAGKDWSTCPGNQVCTTSTTPAPIGCFSFSNDASLLLPTNALGQSYRVTGYSGSTIGLPGPFVVVTATVDGTQVTIQLSAAGSVLAGTGVAAIAAGGTQTFTLNAGDVLLLQAASTADLGGSSITASHPVQVISGSPCSDVPDNTLACDHLEESVLPDEALGKRYFVTVPTGPSGTTVAHIVRLYGLADGTVLTYPGTPPAGAPTTLNAGQVADLGQVAEDFEVDSSHPIAVDAFLLSGALADPLGNSGDPSQTIVVPAEQYRTRYAFASPLEYQASYVNIVEPDGATVSLDGATVSATPTPIGSSGFSVVRVPLVNSTSEHLLSASAPVGIEILGYGSSTSYEYPGGLDLRAVAP